jgi:hypothetical protein
MQIWSGSQQAPGYSIRNGLAMIHTYQTKQQEFTVGMPVTRHPPYRSQRALLMHWAPALSSDAHAFIGIGMTDKGNR